MTPASFLKVKLSSWEEAIALRYFLEGKNPQDSALSKEVVTRIKKLILLLNNLPKDSSREIALNYFCK